MGSRVRRLLPASGEEGFSLNPTPGSVWTASEPAVQNEFVRRLNEAGIPTTLRDTRGKEIDGACGQLVATEEDRAVAASVPVD